LAVPLGLPKGFHGDFLYQKHWQMFPWQTTIYMAETGISHFIN